MTDRLGTEISHNNIAVNDKLTERFDSQYFNFTTYLQEPKLKRAIFLDSFRGSDVNTSKPNPNNKYTLHRNMAQISNRI